MTHAIPQNSVLLRIHWLVWLVAFAWAMPGAHADDSVFWVGESPAAMKPREQPHRYALASGIYLCKPYSMSDYTAAFVRGGKCYLLHSETRRHPIGRLPLAGGDRLFLLRSKEDLKGLNFAVLEGDAAVTELMALLPRSKK